MAFQILRNGVELKGTLRIKADGTQKETVIIQKSPAGPGAVTLEPDAPMKISAVEGNYNPTTGQFAVVIGPTFDRGNVSVVVNGSKSFTVRFF